MGFIILWIITELNLFPTSTRSEDARQSYLQLLQKKPLVQTCKNRKPTLSPSPLPRIAIASFPESGAELIQQLLQNVTGIVTGNTYCKGSGYKPCLQNKYVLTVSTHNPWTITDGYEKAVVLIRSPYTAIVEEFNKYILGLPKKYSRESSQYQHMFSDYVRPKGDKWIATYESWLSFNGSKEIVFYADLLAKPARVISSILNLANINPKDLPLNCLKEVTMQPLHQRSFNPSQMTMFSVEFRINIERKISEFENKIAKIKNATAHTLHRDI